MSATSEVLAVIVVGSKSDWDTMDAGAEILCEFEVPHECRVLSAHRTPTQLVAYMNEAEERGCEVFIGGAGGAAHLPGVMAAHTLRPVIGVPVESVLQGIDSLLSIAQMPAGIPVATMAIGKAGGVNAALFATAILGLSRPELAEKLQEYRDKRADKVLSESLPKRSTKMGFRP